LRKLRRALVVPILLGEELRVVLSEEELEFELVGEDVLLHQVELECVVEPHRAAELLPALREHQQDYFLFLAELRGLGRAELQLSAMNIVGVAREEPVKK